jgi:hypothetical protein
MIQACIDMFIYRNTWYIFEIQKPNLLDMFEYAHIQ